MGPIFESGRSFGPRRPELGPAFEAGLPPGNLAAPLALPGLQAGSALPLPVLEAPPGIEPAWDSGQRAFDGGGLHADSKGAPVEAGFAMSAGFFPAPPPMPPFTNFAQDTYKARFTPDGRIMSVQGDGKVVFWDSLARTRLLEIQASPDWNHAALSPDGFQVVTTSRKAPVQVWDAHTGSLVREFKELPAGDYEAAAQRLWALSEQLTAR